LVGQAGRRRPDAGRSAMATSTSEAVTATTVVPVESVSWSQVNYPPSCDRG